MQRLPFAPILGTIDPRSHLGLRSFSCGTTGEDHGIHKLIGALRAGLLEGDVIAAEGPKEELLGLIVVQHRPLVDGVTNAPIEGVDARDYILFVAREWKFRGSRLLDGETIGETLVKAAISHLGLKSGGAAPGVWAMVPPGHSIAHSLLERHGFEVTLPRASFLGDLDYKVRLAD